MRNCAILIVLACQTTLQAQKTVTIDWVAKKPLSQPSAIQETTNVTVSVENVNDVLYTYSISATSTPAAIDDFSLIAKAFSLAGQAAKGAGEGATCDPSAFLQSVKDLTDAENAFVNLPSTQTGCSAQSPCSISLTDAKDDWEKNVQPKLDLAKAAQKASQSLCSATEYQTAYASSKHALDQGDRTASLLNNPIHQAQSTIVMKPDSITNLEVDEYWKGTRTKTGQYNVTLNSANTRLTLSAGALFSQVQNRSYASVAVANSSGSGTINVLQVNGVSQFSPTALALLNYEIPRASSEMIGLAVSTGPVFRLGSKSDTSSFGYFGGLSVHLYHRFYGSAGFHFGEFADFPTGFTHAGQTIPPGVGSPTPVKRWTWRFGFGLTYKAKDFSAFGMGASVTPSSPSQAPANNQVTPKDKTATSSDKPAQTH